VTNSPWETTANVDADLLPSANVLQTADEPPPAPEPPSELVAPRRGSRLGMTIGLAVVMLVLSAVVIYLTMFDKSGDQSPADVKVGSEQRDYGDEPVPSASASATAAPTHRRPRYQPPRPVHKANKPADIYEDL